MFKKLISTAVLTMSIVANWAKADTYAGFSIGYPFLAGMQVGYLPTAGQSGITARLTAKTLFFLAYQFQSGLGYQIATDSRGSGVYFGAETGTLLTSYSMVWAGFGNPAKPQTIWLLNIGAFAGYNWQLSRSVSLFGEISTDLYFGYASPVFLPAVNIGLNYRF